MDPETPLKTATMETPLKTTPTDKTDPPSPKTSVESNEFELRDSPDYIAPDKQDILLLDITSPILHSRISEVWGVTYLSPAESVQTCPLYGRLCGLNKRLMVNVVTRRRSRRGQRGPAYASKNIIFLCDTASPNTFICAEAMGALLGTTDALPKSLLVQMADFPAVEAHLSPDPSHYHDVNVIGMDLMSQLQVTIFGKDLEFELKNMDHNVD